MGIVEECRTQRVRSGMDAFEEALSWVVQIHDSAEFTDATMVKILVEQVFELDDDSPEGGRYLWEGTVSGITDSSRDG